MSAVKIKDNIYWVGAVDRDVRNFHGYLTPVGSTYNAYLVLDEKITLIDTVKASFTDEMLDNIREIVDPAKIDYHISNHTEPDHSGALPALAALCPNMKVICSPNGQKGLSAYYPDVRMDFQPVKTGDTLNTGKFTFEFVLMPLVHWPDSMSTYLRGEELLFSNDALGQHIAGPERFDDELGYDRLMERAGDYYANIVLPFGAQVKKLLADIGGFSISVICPSHGVMLRKYIGEMVGAYARWAASETDPARAVIVYDTMWGSTRMLADGLEADLRAGGYTVETLCLRDTHVSTCMAALLDAHYIAVGCPTLNRQVMPTMAAFLSYVRGLSPKNRRGRAFGSYGWSGESVGIIEETLKALGWEIDPPVKSVWRP